MGKSHRAPGSRRGVLWIAGLMFAAVFGARFAVSALGTGIGYLYVLPIVLVATELGRRAGVAAGVTALGLFAVWAELAAPEVGLVGYLSRALVFVVVGAVTGQMADRVRQASERERASARHFELARDMLATANLDGYLTHVNASWEELLGWTPQELTSRPFIELVHPDDRERTEIEAARAFADDLTATFTNRYRAKDGSWHWIEWSSKVDTARGVIYAAARDVSEREAVEQARRAAEERFRRGFEDSAVGMALVGVEGEESNVILEANESLAKIFDRPREGLVGTNTFATLAHPDDAPEVAEGMRRLYGGQDRVYRGEFRVCRPDRRELWVHLTSSIVRDEQGRPLYRLSQVMDIDASKRAEHQLRYLADHDSLSGVFNRRRFEQELERELGYSAAGRSHAALLLLDVDDFKRINDSLGHAAGDAVIARLGQTLTGRLRSGDVVARLGGDEFAVLLRRVDADEALAVANDLIEIEATALSELAGERSEPVTVSIGVVPFGDADPPSADDLLSMADEAMYEAKRAGGNRASIPLAAARG